jgi:hypothetical protein
MPVRRRRRPEACGSEKAPVTGHPGSGARLPSRGSLSSDSPPNFVPIIQALCTNSNWRAIFALRQMK